jgi:hypothetical protein
MPKCLTMSSSATSSRRFFSLSFPSFSFFAWLTFFHVQGSRPKNNQTAARKLAKDLEAEEETPKQIAVPGRIVLAAVENLPLRPSDKRKLTQGSPSFMQASAKAAKVSPPQAGGRRKTEEKYRSIADDCLDFMTSDSLVDVPKFKQIITDYLAAQDGDNGKYGQLVLDGSMIGLFQRFVKLQTFVIESLNTKYSLSIKSLTPYGVTRTSEAWAALGPEVSEMLSTDLDSYMKIADDTFFSIGNLLIDPVSVLFFLSVHIVDAYKSRHSDKKPFLMHACKGVAQVNPPPLFLFFVYPCLMFLLLSPRT